MSVPVHKFQLFCPVLLLAQFPDLCLPLKDKNVCGSFQSRVCPFRTKLFVAQLPCAITLSVLETLSTGHAPNLALGLPDRYRLVGLLVKAAASRAEDPGFAFRLRRDFSGSSHTSDLKLALQWLPCQGSSDIGTALGLVGLVSVYCDWLR